MDMHAQSSATLLAVDLKAAICETHTFQTLYLDPKWSIDMGRSHILHKSCMCTGRPNPNPPLLSSQVQTINTNIRRPKALGHQVWFLEVKCYDKWKVNSVYSLFIMLESILWITRTNTSKCPSSYPSWKHRLNSEQISLTGIFSSTSFLAKSFEDRCLIISNVRVSRIFECLTNKLILAAQTHRSIWSLCLSHMGSEASR